MKSRRSQIWLFAFADLAFLLLIAFTQVSSMGVTTISFGEMPLPEAVKNEDIKPLKAPGDSWQLRIHSPEASEQGPFQMVYFLGGEMIPYDFFPHSEMTAILEKLAGAGVQRPVVVPAKDSLSKDMIYAISMVKAVWPRAAAGVTVRPVSEEEATGE